LKATAVVFIFVKSIYVSFIVPMLRIRITASTSCASTGYTSPSHDTNLSVIPVMTSMTEITQPCVHMCNGLFICQLYLLPELLEEMDSKEDTPLTLPFASFVSLSQLIIVI
jgi:hypothetical protein